MHDIRAHCSVCLYNYYYYHWVSLYIYIYKTSSHGSEGLRTRCDDGGFTQKSKIIPEGGRGDSLKQFRNFSKPFLSALIKFVQSKPIIYENKTIWKRWCSNTLSALSPPTLAPAQRLWRKTADKRAERVLQSQYFQKAFAEALKATGIVWFFLYSV